MKPFKGDSKPERFEHNGEVYLKARLWKVGPNRFFKKGPVEHVTEEERLAAEGLEPPE